MLLSELKIIKNYYKNRFLANILKVYYCLTGSDLLPKFHKEVS